MSSKSTRQKNNLKERIRQLESDIKTLVLEPDSYRAAEIRAKWEMLFLQRATMDYIWNIPVREGPPYKTGGIIEQISRDANSEAKEPEEFKKIVVKHRLGDPPGDMATEWWTSEDWKKWDEYVEKLKRDGDFGKETESTILLRPHPFFDNNHALALDPENIEKHEFIPLNNLLNLNNHEKK